MNKKTIIIVCVIVAICLITLGIQNKNLKSEKAALNEEVESIESHATKKKDSAKMQQVHIEAKKTAVKFVKSYFAYEGKPNEKEVSQFVTNDIKKSLSFGDEEGYELDDLKVGIEELNSYYGEKTDERQQILITFNSTMSMDGNKTAAPSFLKLDMIKNDEGWKVDNMEFEQY